MYKAKRNGADHFCALKIIDKSKLDHSIKKELMIQELEVCRELNHPNIVQVQEMLHDQRFFYIAAELCEGGEFFERISTVKVFTENKAAYIIKQILLAVNLMHQRDVVHRDLKPANILMVSSDKQNL